MDKYTYKIKFRLIKYLFQSFSNSVDKLLINYHELSYASENTQIIKQAIS